MKINLTDQELNEWVAEKVMGWTKFKSRQKRFIQTWIDEEGEENIFFPAQNLNHSHLMEDKIKETGKENEWWENLKNLIWNSSKEINDEGNCMEQINKLRKFTFDIAHASARQRCEAAYLTFKDEK